MSARESEARWKGTLKAGGVTMLLASGPCEGPYTCKSRFGDGAGTNPEEMIGTVPAITLTTRLLD